MKVNQPILITGCPRSGAGIIAGIVSLCGAGGGMMNKLYENKEIKNRIVSPLLRLIKADTDGYYPLPYHYPIKNWSNDIHSAMIRQGVNLTKEWFYNDSRMLLLQDIFINSFPNAKWIVVLRDRANSIRSCVKNDYMFRFQSKDILNTLKLQTEEDGWNWMLEQYDILIHQLRMKLGSNLITIEPTALLNGDLTPLKTMLEWINLPFKETEINEFLKLKLRGYENNRK